MPAAHNERRVEAPPEVVFAVVSDPTTYPEWLAGASTITDVDDDWPRVGSTFSHRIGFGPAVIPGSTTVRALEPGRRLDLGAGMGPFGEAAVSIRIRPVEAGSADTHASMVSIDEVPRRGVARLAWRVTTPLIRAALWGRNALSLDELDRVITGDRSAQ